MVATPPDQVSRPSDCRSHLGGALCDAVRGRVQSPWRFGTSGRMPPADMYVRYRTVAAHAIDSAVNGSVVDHTPLSAWAVCFEITDRSSRWSRGGSRPESRSPGGRRSATSAANATGAWPSLTPRSTPSFASPHSTLPELASTHRRPSRQGRQPARRVTNSANDDAVRASKPTTALDQRSSAPASRLPGLEGTS